MADQNQSPRAPVDVVQQNAVRHADDAALTAQSVLCPDAQVDHIPRLQLRADPELVGLSNSGVVVRDSNHPAGQILPVVNPPRRDVIGSDVSVRVREGGPGQAQSEDRRAGAGGGEACPGERGEEGTGHRRRGVRQQDAGGAAAAQARRVAGRDCRPVGITVLQQHLCPQGHRELHTESFQATERQQQGHDTFNSLYVHSSGKH